MKTLNPRLFLKKLKETTTTSLYSIFVANAASYIFAAPILLWWGMPQSSMSLVGNIIFAPFLALFILLCSMVMGLSLFGTTSWVVNTPLEHLTQFWMQCLQLGTKGFLHGQQAHPIILLMTIAIVLITGWGVTQSATKKRLALTLLCGYVATSLVLFFPLTSSATQLTNRSGSLKITQQQTSHVTLRDEGYLKGLRNAAKNIPFTVKRHLMQQHGTLCIHEIELTQVTPGTLRSLNELIIVTTVKKIRMPRIHPPQKPSTWRQLGILRSQAKKDGITIGYTTPFYVPKLRGTTANALTA